MHAVWPHRLLTRLSPTTGPEANCRACQSTEQKGEGNLFARQQAVWVDGCVCVVVVGLVCVGVHV